MKFIEQFQSYNLPNLGWTRLPKPPITLEDREKYESNETESNSKFLSRLAMAGFKKKLEDGVIPKEKFQIYIDRCKMELDTFDELHFTDYMLLVWKVMHKAKELGVFWDFGRGSVAGSIVSWFLGISGCDPIKYNLFFSRFLNKARAKSKEVNGEIWIDISLVLDIDINLGNSREEIVKWLKEIYPNRVCKISNISTLTGKILVKDVYKAFENATEEEAKEVSDLIERRFGFVEDIEKTYQNNIEFKNWADNHKKTYEICLKLRNLIRQTSSHASGYLLSFEELTGHTPLCLDSEKKVMSNYTMDDVQCLKLDLLSLETNFIIKEILDNINEDISKVNLDDDPLIYNELQKDNFLPYGLYQISGDCAYKVCTHLKPKNIMELSHVSAISRPVSLIYEKPYIEQTAKCPHSLFEEALKWTRFVPLYQEQTLLCLKAIGYTDIEAEIARRVFAKKKHDEVEEQVIKVKEKIKQLKLPEEAGKILIQLCEDGANYQFNLSHSLSTSYLTSCTVYLKYKYPLQFYKACLNEAKNKPDFTERLGQIADELPHFNIRLLPPHIFKSSEKFTIEGNDIRFALTSIKGISAKSLERLRRFQNEQFNDKFSLFLAADEANLPANIVSALILCGGLDDILTETRSRTLSEYHIWTLLTGKNEKQWTIKLAKEYNYDLIEIVKALNEKIKDEKGKPIIKDSRRVTIRKHFAPFLEMYNFNKRNEDLLKYLAEKFFIGFSYTTNLYNIYAPKVDNLMTVQEIKGLPQDTVCKFVGEVVDVKLSQSKEKKTPYLRLNIKDHTGELRCMIFSKKLERCKEINGGVLPKSDDIVLVTAKKMDGDTVFADVVAVQETNIFLKATELKKKQTTEDLD